MLLYGKKVKHWIFFRKNLVYDVKVGICNKLNKNMNLCEYQRSRSFTDLGPKSFRFNILKLLFLRNWPIKTKFHMEPPWVREMKDYSNSPGHMINMAPMPIYNKTLNIFFAGTKRLMTLLVRNILY